MKWRAYDNKLVEDGVHQVLTDEVKVAREEGRVLLNGDFDGNLRRKGKGTQRERETMNSITFTHSLPLLVTSEDSPSF